MNFKKIFISKKTVFTVDDLKKILDTNNEGSIRNYLSREVKRWLIESIFPWYFKIIWRDVDNFELASKLKDRSYISLETALQKYWIIFQDYSHMITSVSNNSITKQVSEIYFEYKKIKDDILYNPLWIINKWNYSIASKERAICDIIYLKSWFTFDNLNSIDKEKLEEISMIYNKRTILEIKNIIKNA